MGPFSVNLPFLSPFWFEPELIKHVYYEQKHQNDIHFAAVELFMTYKRSIEIPMQNVVGGVMCTQGTLYSTRTIFIQHFKRLESILMQSLELLRNKTYNNKANN